MKKLFIGTLICVVLSTLLLTCVNAQDSYTDLFSDTQQFQETEYKQKFWDVPKSHWAFTAIAELADRGAIGGYGDGSFKPSNTVTRAEWAKIMIVAAGLPANDFTARFSDMEGHWATPFVNAASSYLTAFSDNSYRPNQAVTREDVTMAMVKLKGYNLSDVDYSVLSNFKDVASISNSIKVYVAIAVEKGLITGFDDGTFRGQATLTRAQAATLLWRAFQFGNDNKTTASSSSSANDTPAGSSSVYEPQDNNAQTEDNSPDRKPDDTPAKQPEAEGSEAKPETDISAENLSGSYGDTVSQRAHMDITKKNGIYKIKISWSSSSAETTRWYFDAKPNKSGVLEYENGYEYNLISEDDGTTSYELVNDDCEGSFEFDGNLLVWNDFSEDISKKCMFEKTGSSDNDNSYVYEEAKNALEEYLNVCMTVNYSEDGNEKKRRISKYYNTALGMLLDCFGYKDSDELITKLNSTHKIALQLPDSIKTISRDDFSFYSCYASMRDTKLFIEKEGFYESGDLSLSVTYDYSEFKAEMVDIYEDSIFRPISLAVSLFAENYRHAEFQRLFNKAYEQAGGSDEAEFEMNYGGYGLKFSIEPCGYRYVSITVKGTYGKNVSSGNNTADEPSFNQDKENDRTPVFDEDEDEEDEPVNNKKPVFDEDEDEEDEPVNNKKPVFDEDEDEEDEPVNNKKPVFDEDEDEEDEINKNDEDEEEYLYKSYYAKYIIDENHTGSIITWSEKSVKRHLREENATLDGEIQVFELTTSEYMGDSFKDEETGRYYYLDGAFDYDYLDEILDKKN